MTETKGIIRESNPEVMEAKNYLRRKFFDEKDLHYKGVTYEGDYPRYHFYKGDDRTIIYTVVSEEERKQLKEKDIDFAV